jgi:hypothetical protein
MKSFFQLSEQVRKHKLRKLREADGDTAPSEAEPAKAVATQANQNNQSDNQEPKQTNFAEIPDVDLVMDFQKKLDLLAKDKANAAALVKMKEIPSTQAFATAFTNAQAELQKAVAALQAEDKEEKSGKSDKDAGSNTAGSAASTPPAQPPTSPTPTPGQSPPPPG